MELTRTQLMFLTMIAHSKWSARYQAFVETADAGEKLDEALQVLIAGELVTIEYMKYKLTPKGEERVEAMLAATQ